MHMTFKLSCICLLFLCSWEPILKYINEQYDKYLVEETSIKRKPRVPDSRVHCCLYFIAPTGHRWVMVDVTELSKQAMTIDRKTTHMHIILTYKSSLSNKGCTGRIWALCLDTVDPAKHNSNRKDQELSQYGPKQAWLIFYHITL